MSVNRGRRLHGPQQFLRCTALAAAILSIFAAPAQAQSLPAAITNVALVTPPPAAPQSSRPDEPLLFPHNFLRGYIDAGFAPPPNEPDLGRCNQFGPPCTAFARYVFGGYVEFQPLGRGPLKHFYAFFEPRFFAGNNIPQHRYTAAADPLALERVIGLGVELPKNFEFRLTSHRVTSFGKFANSLGPTDSGPDKPLGLYTLVGVRWYFGGYGHGASSW